MSGLSDLINGLGKITPTAYGQWGKGNVKPLPYAIVIDTGDDDFFADNMRYRRTGTWRVEFYFERKDPNLETKIESFFDANDFAWACDGDEYINTESMFERVYYLEKGESTND